MRLHPDVSHISFHNRAIIHKVFKEILGLHNIDHFSLDLVSPEGEMLFFSGTPSHAYEICKRGYGQYDGIISPENYESNEFYWWKNACHKAFSEKITEIRENVLNLRNGFMLVRNIDDFYLIYSFATKSLNADFKYMVIDDINTFLSIGDYIYMEMRELYTNYCKLYEPPEMEIFYKFKGGKPIPRYTKNFIKDKNKIIIPSEKMIINKKSNMIFVDFKKKEFSVDSNV